MKKNIIVDPTIEELKEFNQLVAELIDKDFDSFTFEPLEAETVLTIQNRAPSEPNNATFEPITYDTKTLVADYLDAIKPCKSLTVEEEAQLVLQVSKDDPNARRQLVEANLTLVVLIAEKYQGHGLPMLDLIQEGNIGLIQARDKFDYRMEFRFRTYAAWWIAWMITQAIVDQAANNKNSAQQAEKSNYLLLTQQGLRDEAEYEPDPAELALRIEEGEKLRALIEAKIQTGKVRNYHALLFEEIDKEIGIVRETIPAIRPEVVREMRMKGLI